MKTSEILLRLINTFGITSYENNVYKEIKNILGEYYPEISFDNYGTGSLVAKYGNEGKKIALFAHADEIGVVVSKIENSQFVRVAPVGGVDPRTLIAKRILLRTADGEKTGVAGMLAPHLQSAATKDKSPSFDELFIDFSISGGTKNIEVGDMGVIKTEGTELENGFITGKSIDNRAGITVLLKTIDYLKDLKFKGELYLSFNKGEEVGLVGATGMANMLNPDAAIVVDVTFAGENESNFEIMKMDEGPAIAVGAPVNRDIFESLKNTAEENNIKYQVEVTPNRSGTEADSVQTSLCGIRTGIVSVPIMNMHSPVEIVSCKDIDDSAKLIALFAFEEAKK
ncbi:MAG: M20/M25/M40 family metallo-hydrolase [Thermotogae bacterium]|nr:M20/M25/M40 family metallo-hydrolase [Thermotogota bacterium]HOO74906.1 M20/M25/M40 family metallo-hydrolase [Tepiditoga sp.]